MLRELNDEAEDGETRVHVFLEDAMEAALNNGAQGVEIFDADELEKKGERPEDHEEDFKHDEGRG